MYYSQCVEKWSKKQSAKHNNFEVSTVGLESPPPLTLVFKKEVNTIIEEDKERSKFIIHKNGKSKVYFLFLCI